MGRGGERTLFTSHSPPSLPHHEKKKRYGNLSIHSCPSAGARSPSTRPKSCCTRSRSCTFTRGTTKGLRSSGGCWRARVGRKGWTRTRERCCAGMRPSVLRSWAGTPPRREPPFFFFRVCVCVCVVCTKIIGTHTLVVIERGLPKNSILAGFSRLKQHVNRSRQVVRREGKKVCLKRAFTALSEAAVSL